MFNTRINEIHVHYLLLHRPFDTECATVARFVTNNEVKGLVVA
jgi:hypothetical protein